MIKDMLIQHQLKRLRLPTMGCQYQKLAQETARDNRPYEDSPIYGIRRSFSSISRSPKILPKKEKSLSWLSMLLLMVARGLG